MTSSSFLSTCVDEIYIDLVCSLGLNIHNFSLKIIVDQNV